MSQGSTSVEPQIPNNQSGLQPLRDGIYDLNYF